MVEIKNLKLKLPNVFELKDLNLLRYFLRTEISHSKQIIFMSHRKCILDLLKEIGMLNSKLTSTTVDLNLNLHWRLVTLSQIGIEKSKVSREINLFRTKSSISFVVSSVSQFTYSPIIPSSYFKFSISTEKVSQLLI